MIGPNQAATAAVPAALDREERHQDGDADVQHIGMEARRHEVEAFDGGEHRDRRRDDGVAVEQRGADHAEPDHEPAALAHDALDQRHQAERAALAAIVHPHDEKHVFERDDHDQRPEHQRHDAEHRFLRHRAAGRRGRQAFLERIKRARADVAIDDPDRAERQCPEPPPRRAKRSRFRPGHGTGCGRRLWRNWSSKESSSRRSTLCSAHI